MTPKQARLGVDIFTGLVIASVALALAGLSWRLMGYDGNEPVVSPVTPGLSSAGTITPLLALAPFGIASGVAVEGGASGLTLRAIFAAFPQSESVALIAGPDGQVIPVSIGDATPGGIVEAIEPETVTLRTSSGLRILGFNPDASTGPVAGFAPVAPTVPVVPAGNGAAATPPVAPSASGVDAIRALIPQSSRPENQAPPPSSASPSPGAPPLVLSPQGAVPVPGYRVGGRLPSRLRSAGIRSGDVIRTVNGNPVRSDTSEQELYGQAMSSDTARIELVRNGKQVAVSVSLR